MNRVALSRRMARAAEGRLSDPTVYAEYIREFFGMPLEKHAVFRWMRDTRQALGISIKDMADMSCGEAAAKIHHLWSSPDGHDNAVKMLKMLSQPYYRAYRIRSRNG